jgi:redox-sensing transcriptional repressor
MAKKSEKQIPAPVVLRLIKYLTHIRWLCEQNVSWVLSQDMADTLGLTSSTVRQDLSHLDFSGKSRCGYQTFAMEEAVSKALRMDKRYSIILVGIGNFGKALALNQAFKQNNFNLCGLYDKDPKIIGKKIGSLVVKDVSVLPSEVRKHKVQLAMLAVSAPAAQQVADLVILSGIRGILNLTMTHIVVPERIAVVDLRVTSALQELAYYVSCKKIETII